MQWLNQYQLFLFDFDGLLVNTEELHFQAYQIMCEARGFKLLWTFATYCSIAHYSAQGIRERIYAEFPELYRIEPSWDILYKEKKDCVKRLFKGGAVKLMPGAARLLWELKARGILSCVVTHSPMELVSLIREQHPALNAVSHWITRENYTRPKPHPECYLKAIELHRKKGASVIGFEDAPRGLQALMQTPSLPVWISKIAYPEIQEWQKKGVIYAPSLEGVHKALGEKST